MNTPTLASDYLFSYEADLAPPVVLGPCPDGIRVLFQVTGGTVSGPRLNGKVMPVGADWLTVRSDGIAVVDVRAQLQASDGGLIDLRYGGVIDFGESGYADFAAGQVGPSVAIRVAPRVHTADPALAWLNRLQLVGIGQGDLAARRVRYDVFAIG
ncbi:MAG: DUF3237 domain-containing protein [Abyssibacter sp.]|uniref:DUF3237 domain-containing protein n=1 Tax=Abyssibacter sp. TaxID=2320200 RepID=UPI003218E19A